MKACWKFAVVALVLSVFVSSARAVVVTNLGQEVTVTLMSERAEGSTTVTKDQSVRPTGVDRRGIYVVHYDMGTTSITPLGAHDPVSWEIPKGTILQEGGMIEIQTVVSPIWATNSIAVGGVTILDAGTLLGSGTIVPLTVGNLPAITTSDDEVTVTLGAASSNLVMTIYLPVILGNDQ